MAIKFLVDSIDKNYGGSRAYFSRLYNPFNGWSSMYPETCHIIPTLLGYGKRFNSDLEKSKAIILADWLLSIQNSDGSFPGLLYTKNNHSKSIFNSAQIIIGLVSIYKYTSSKDYLNALSNVPNGSLKIKTMMDHGANIIINLGLHHLTILESHGQF